ncbi:MAG TPA: hypothetical protein ENK16_00120, partial [Chromatiales bacterium]|nr:hypothetical protein [Chromatiales bacterium]
METEPQQETPESQPGDDGARERAPAGPVEIVLANFRPQPAIPAVLVFMLSVLIPILSLSPQGGAASSSSVFMWLVPLGILASCGLAIAAGFCSFFPQTIWIVAAVWALRFTNNG